MQSVDYRALEKLDEQMTAALKKAPAMRRELHERLAHEIQNDVRGHISDTTKTHSGNLQSWQEKYVGSEGGYAAVRASDESTGDQSPGAITNYVNSGHKIRTPSGSDPNYRPRINVSFVNGAHFYEEARATVEKTAVMVAEDFLGDLAKTLEGR